MSDSPPSSTADVGKPNPRSPTVVPAAAAATTPTAPGNATPVAGKKTPASKPLTPTVNAAAAPNQQPELKSPDPAKPATASSLSLDGAKTPPPPPPPPPPGVVAAPPPTALPASSATVLFSADSDISQPAALVLPQSQVEAEMNKALAAAGIVGNNKPLAAPPQSFLSMSSASGSAHHHHHHSSASAGGGAPLRSASLLAPIKLDTNEPVPPLREWLLKWLTATTAPNSVTNPRNAINQICTRLGIETLEDFCCQPATRLAEVGGFDAVLAYRAVSDAHRELKRGGAPIDWIEMLLQAYSGEEEALWRSVREKYEHDIAVAAAVFDVAMQQKMQQQYNAMENEQVQRNRMRAAAGGNNSSAPELEDKIRELTGTVQMLQQMYASSQDDLRAMAHEYNEAVARLTERAEKAEAEKEQLRMVNVEQLEWIKVLEQRLGQKGVGGGMAAAAAGRSSSTGFGGGRSPFAAAAAVGGLSQAARVSLRARLTEFYFRFDPSRVPEVDAVLEQWAGREAELEKLIETEPTVVES